MTPAIASEPYTAEAPSFRTSTRSMAANGITARFTPCTPWISPAKPFTRLPLMSTRVCPPCRPRRFAVCADSVVAPMVLVRATLPTELLAEMSCSNSIGVVAPLLSISSREITVTGSAVSPSTRLMLDPVTSMRSLAAGSLVCWANTVVAAPDDTNAKAPATAMASVFFLRFIIYPQVFCKRFTESNEHEMDRQRNSAARRPRRCLSATPPTLLVNSHQDSWNFSAFRGRRACGAGLRQHSIQDADGDVRIGDKLYQPLGAAG